MSSWTSVRRVYVYVQERKKMVYVLDIMVCETCAWPWSLQHWVNIPYMCLSMGLMCVMSFITCVLLTFILRRRQTQSFTHMHTVSIITAIMGCQQKFIIFLSVSYLLHVFASLHYLSVCLHRSIWAYIMCMLACCQSRCKRPSASLLHEFTDSWPAEKCLCVCDRVNTGANSGEMDEQRDEWRHGKERFILLCHSYGTDYIHSPE